MNYNFIFYRSLVLFFSLLITQDSLAQWKSNGPYGGQVNALVSKGSDLFAGTRNSVYVSHDHGANWLPASAGIEHYQIFELITNGSDIFAGSDGMGVLMSSDNGVTWADKNNGLAHQTVYSMLSAGQDLYAATNGGVYFSANSANLWTLATSGIPQGYQVRAWAAMGDTVYAGTYGVGMYRSNNKGQSWQKVGNGFPSTQITIYVYDMHVAGNTILASTNHGIYRSTDRGLNWSLYGSGLPQGNYIMSFGAKAGILVGAMPYVGMFISTDNGATWTKSNNGLKQWSLNTASYEKYAWFTDLAISGQNIVVSSEEGIFSSADNGANWNYSDEGIRGCFVPAMALTQGAVLAATGESGIFVSTDKGQSWQRTNNGIPEPSIKDIAANSSFAFVSVINAQVYRSSDQGASWTLAYGNLPRTPFDLEANDVRVAGILGKTPNETEKLYQSKDNGLTWSLVPNTPPGLSALALYEDEIYIGTNDGMLLMTNNEGVTWTDLSGYMPEVEITTILPMDSVVYVGTSGQGIFQFSNNGNTMLLASFGLGSMWISDIVEMDGLFFSSSTAGVYASKNGLFWFNVNEGLDDLNARYLLNGGDKLYVGTSTGVHQTGEDVGFFSRVRLLSGIDEDKIAAGTVFFPNPSDGLIYYEGHSDLKIEMYNMQGQLLFSDQGKKAGVIDFRDHPSGVYVVKTKEKGTTVVNKIVLR